MWINLGKYKGKWVALSENEEEIVASNDKAKPAYEDAILKGVKTPILFKVPEILAPYVGSV